MDIRSFFGKQTSTKMAAAGSAKTCFRCRQPAVRKCADRKTCLCVGDDFARKTFPCDEAFCDKCLTKGTLDCLECYDQPSIRDTWSTLLELLPKDLTANISGLVPDLPTETWTNIALRVMNDYPDLVKPVESAFIQFASQYRTGCDNCGCRLTANIHIFCLRQKKREDRKGDQTWCSDCWMTHEKEAREEGWVCDEDDEDEDEDDCDAPDVDDRDAPNVFPYKMCSVCGERKSCGNYDHDHKWFCEDCSAKK